MLLRCKFKQFWIAAVATAAALVAPALHAGPLRVCADPDNLPFSKADGPERGLYIELAELVGSKLGMPVDYVWWLTYNQRRALRNSMDGCDAYFALPADADYRLRGLVRTKAFLDVRYAIVAPPALKVQQLADLKGRRVGVLHASPPHILMATREGYTTSSYRDTGEALAALARGEVDAAILWGPSAGFDIGRQFAGRWTVTPVSGEGLGGGVAVAVPRDKAELAARIDKALAELQPQIRALAVKYGFPLAAPLPLSANHVSPVRPAAVTAGVSVPSAWIVQATATAASAPAAAPTAVPAAGKVDLGPARVRFNDTCSHCHGKDGASPISERDLRRLKLRYKDDWNNVALKTIRDGRLDQGMPAWKDTYSEQQIQELVGFLATIQR